MKKTIYILIIILLVISSCKKDVLDKVPLNLITDATVWSDPALVNAYLTECYAESYVFANVSYDNSWNNLWLGDAGPAAMNISEISDEGKSCWFGFSYKYGQLKIGGGLFEWWEPSYKVIRMLNEFIKRVPASPLDAAVKKQRTAEAKWLRAFNYFEMVKRYGGVPLILEAQSASMPKDSLYPKRNKEQEVYDFVIAETFGLRAGSQGLPTT